MAYKLAICLLLTASIWSCKSISFQEYFPLYKNKTTVFIRRIDSTNQTFTDTLICREALAKTMINSTKKKLLLSNTLRDNYIINGRLNLYYFERTTFDSNSKIWMHDNSFAERLYCFKNGKLYVGYDWRKDMVYDTELELLFPKKLKQAVDYKHRNGDYWKSFKYTAKEAVKVNDTVYQDCLKMDIYETFGSSKKIGTVWFARNVGLIKWDIRNEKADYIPL